MVYIDNAGRIPSSLGPNAGDSGVFRRPVVVDHKTMTDVGHAIICTDALIIAVSNDAVLNRNIGVINSEEILVS